MNPKKTLAAVIGVPLPTGARSDLPPRVARVGPRYRPQDAKRTGDRHHSDHRIEQVVGAVQSHHPACPRFQRVDLLGLAVCASKNVEAPHRTGAALTCSPVCTLCPGRHRGGGRSGAPDVVTGPAHPAADRELTIPEQDRISPEQTQGSPKPLDDAPAAGAPPDGLSRSYGPALPFQRSRRKRSQERLALVRSQACLVCRKSPRTPKSEICPTATLWRKVSDGSPSRFAGLSTKLCNSTATRWRKVGEYANLASTTCTKSYGRRARCMWPAKLASLTKIPHHPS